MAAQDTTKPLTLREKLAIKLLLIIFAVIKPMEWNQEADKYIKEFDELMKADKV